MATILNDFGQRRAVIGGISISQVEKSLRPWLGLSPCFEPGASAPVNAVIS